jgi:hypothetical protein
MEACRIMSLACKPFLQAIFCLTFPRFAAVVVSKSFDGLSLRDQTDQTLK